MELYEIEVITEPIYFRKMRVESGYLYNFYDCKEERYQKEWIFVPDVTQQIIIGETGKFPEVKVEPLKNQINKKIITMERKIKFRGKEN